MYILNLLPGERVMIGDEVVLLSMRPNQDKARPGVKAPRGVTILQGELVETNESGAASPAD
jgi:sRNA-binding carbon storage regulator CsrA